MHTLNGIVSLLTMAVLSFVVLHPRINEGLWIKGGLGLMILSLLASAMLAFADGPLEMAYNVGLALRVGILLVCVGYILKYRLARHRGEGTDFGSLSGF